MKTEKEVEQEIEAILFLNFEAKIKKKDLRIIFNIKQEQLTKYIENINKKYKKINSSLNIEEKKTQYIMHIKPEILTKINEKIENNAINEKDLSILHIIANNAPIEINKLKQKLKPQNINKNITRLENKKLIKIIEINKEKIIYLTKDFFKKYSIENKDELKKKNKIQNIKKNKICKKKQIKKHITHTKLPKIEIINYKNIVQIKKKENNNLQKKRTQLEKRKTEINSTNNFKTNINNKDNNINKNLVNKKNINKEPFLEEITQKLKKFEK